MYFEYEDYLIEENSLSLEEMRELHHQMMMEIGKDEDALDLYRELTEQANRYVMFRASWVLWDTAEKNDKDASRSSCHNSLIVKFNQLARYLNMQGKSATWRDVIGYEEESVYNRKRIGDFACYIVFVNCLNAR